MIFQFINIFLHPYEANDPTCSEAGCAWLVSCNLCGLAEPSWRVRLCLFVCMLIGMLVIEMFYWRLCWTCAVSTNPALLGMCKMWGFVDRVTDPCVHLLPRWVLTATYRRIFPTLKWCRNQDLRPGSDWPCVFARFAEMTLDKQGDFFLFGSKCLVTGETRCGGRSECNTNLTCEQLMHVVESERVSSQWSYSSFK